VGRARRAVEHFALAAGADERTAEDARLAVSEAATNVVLHATASRMVVHASCRAGRIDVVVSDDGSGLRARDDSPGLGLGLGIIAACTERLDIAQPSGGGSALQMTFPLPVSVARSAAEPEAQPG
jgi:anti-sigma regulatory factor (Ser/Thr protein kinase)